MENHNNIKQVQELAEFGIWTLPATMGAVRLAQESRFHPAHYDAVERAVRRAGVKQITRQDVVNIKTEIDTYVSAICAQCGLFHMPPACAVAEAELDGVECPF